MCVSRAPVSAMMLPICGENVFEVKGCVYVSGCHVAQYASALAVEYDRAVQNVQKEVDVPRIGKVSSHCLKHPRNQSDPHEFVQHVQAQQLLILYMRQ